jgi:hypothetical protein
MRGHPSLLLPTDTGRHVVTALTSPSSLHQRWQVLRVARRKPAGVVAIATARVLAAFCWEAATLT